MEEHKNNGSVKNHIYNFIYGRVSREFYRDNRGTLDKLNYRMVRTTSLVAAMVTLVIWLSSFLMADLAPYRSVYLGFLIAFTVIAVMICTIFQEMYRATHVIYIALATCIFGYVIIAGTFLSRNELAVLFFVVLILVPMMYVERPLNSMLLALAGSIAFVLTTAYVKQANPKILEFDIINTVCVLALDIVFIWYTRNLHLGNLQASIYFRSQSETDKLTGVSNKSSTESLCQMYLDNLHPGAICAMMIIDLDNFKWINDSLGHKQGDVFLKQTGQALRGIFYEEDIVGRIGGDEFLVLMKNVDNMADVHRKADEVRNEIGKIFSDLTVCRFTCSIGIACSEDGVDPLYGDYYFKADQALYKAKQRGKNQYACYSDMYEQENDKPLMLVVDDIEMSRVVLCSCFENEFNIIQAENGQIAMEYIERYKEKLTVILLDLQMPVMDGYEVLDRLRTDDTTKNIPVLVITVSEEEKERVLRLGADEMIIKPFDPSLIRKNVNTAIENRGQKKNTAKTDIVMR